MLGEKNEQKGYVFEKLKSFFLSFSVALNIFHIYYVYLKPDVYICKTSDMKSD